jgi:hypothetical protein
VQTALLQNFATNEYRESGAADRTAYRNLAAWDRLADHVSFGFSFTTSTNQTSRAVTAPAATVGHPPHGTVHKPNIPKHVGGSEFVPPPHGN